MGSAISALGDYSSYAQYFNGGYGSGSALGGALSGTGVASGVGNGIGGQLGAVAQGIASAIPNVPIANQDALQQQIQMNTNNAGAAAGQQNQFNQQAQTAFGQQQNAFQSAQNTLNDVGGAYNNAQTAVGQAQNAVGNAQQVNQGVGGNVSNAIGLVGQTAAGGGAAQQAANAQLQAGTNQAIASQQAMANSGNLSQMIGGQRTAMQDAAQIQQQNANQAATLQANMAVNAQGQYTGAAAQQASQAAQNAGLQQGQTNALQGQTNAALSTAQAQQAQTAQATNMYGQAAGASNTAQGNVNTASGNALTGQTNALGIQQSALGQSGQNQALAVSGMLNAAGGGLTALVSNYDDKTNVTYAAGPQADQPYNGAGANDQPSMMNNFQGSGGPTFGDTLVNPNSYAPGSTDMDKSLNNSQSYGISQNYQPNPNQNNVNTPPPAFNAFSGIGKTPFKSWQAIPLSSDENKKQDMGQGDDKIKSFLDAIDPVSFDYKQPDGQMGKTPGEHLGVIAQQIEKAPGGKSMVLNTPQGKAIDLPSAVGTLLASSAELNERLGSLEELFKSKRKK